MPKTRSFQTSIPFDDSWDVIVAGGGPSGCTAAAASSREGARTLLIESSGALGGSGTNALVPAWCPFSDREKVIYRGMALQVLNAAKEGMAHVDEQWVDWVPIDAERLKRVYDKFVIDSGATLRFHTFLSGVERDGNGGVDSLIVSNKHGLSALKAKVYIDCTGDADLAVWAGAEYSKGDETGELMPATHCFVLANVNLDAYRNVYNSGHALHVLNPDTPLFKIIESGRYPLIADAHCCCNIIGPGTVGFNAGHIWDVDNTDPESVSRALVHGRRMAEQYRAALVEFCPEAFENAFLVTTGSVVGIRESRRIIGDYILTLDDYLARRSFRDEICRNSYFIDIHHALKDVERSNAERIGVIKETFHYQKGESHGIPYRCLTPKGVRNVIVAGRTVSCDRVVQGSVRIMPVCLAMGEASGIAAALAAKENDSNVHSVDTDFLRQRLREEGGYLP